MNTIVSLARRAALNPVDYACSTGQLSKIDWPSLTDRELRYCKLPLTESVACAAASAEIERRINPLLKSGITLAHIKDSVFLPRLNTCDHVSSDLKVKVEEVSIPVLLAALNGDEQELSKRAASFLLSYWGEGTYEHEVRKAEKRFSAKDEAVFKEAIKAGSLTCPVLLVDDREKLWSEYVNTRDLSDLSIEELIALTRGRWWKMRALHELMERAPLASWLNSSLQETYSCLPIEKRGVLMFGLGQRLRSFEEVRQFENLFMVDYLETGKVPQFQEHILKLAQTPEDLAYLQTKYDLSFNQLMCRMLEIQLVLEKKD